jgi:hypothetical protein
MLNPTALEKLWARDLESHLLPSRAKDGAISPRLGNRYSRFPLSHRSCYDGFCGAAALADNIQSENSETKTKTGQYEG